MFYMLSSFKHESKGALKELRERESPLAPSLSLSTPTSVYSTFKSGLLFSLSLSLALHSLSLVRPVNHAGETESGVDLMNKVTQAPQSRLC